jgi:hypothetical protein
MSLSASSSFLAGSFFMHLMTIRHRWVSTTRSWSPQLGDPATTAAGAALTAPTTRLFLVHGVFDEHLVGRSSRFRPLFASSSIIKERGFPRRFPKRASQPGFLGFAVKGEGAEESSGQELRPFAVQIDVKQSLVSNWASCPTAVGNDAEGMQHFALGCWVASKARPGAVAG